MNHGSLSLGGTVQTKAPDFLCAPLLPGRGGAPILLAKRGAAHVCFELLALMLLGKQ